MLDSLVQAAVANGGAITAISHSTFLRAILAVIQDMPLAQAASTPQKNGCINVVDMKRDGSFVTLGPKSNLFGGPLSQAPSDFELQVPAGRVMRINEIRHLTDLDY